MKDLKTFQESTPTKDWPEHWSILHNLLRPIVWNWSSSISSRQDLVGKRREKVLILKPFLRGTMLSLVDEWLEKERHSGLWD